MLIRTYLSPGDAWWTTLTTIPNDGNDYEFIFEGGEYTIPNVDDVEVDHSYGGSITLRAHIKHDPVLTASIGNNSFQYLWFLCDKFYLDGLRFKGVDYPSPDEPKFLIWVGEWSPTPGFGPAPTELSLTNVRTDGAQIRFQLLCSTDPLYYTDVRVEGCSFQENGHTSVLVKGSIGTGYMNVYVRDCAVTNINGPDKLSDWPTSPTAVSSSGHSNGTQWLEVHDVGGSSTIHISECRTNHEITGSHNHDMHAIRFRTIMSSNVRVHLKDMTIRGHWSSGHVGRPGAKGILHMFYYHFGGPEYLDANDRPIITFENVLFEARIGVGVSVDEFALNPDWPGRELLWINGSATYHFWDCTFRWIVDHATYDNATLAALGDKADNYDATAHNCKFEIGVNGVHWLNQFRVNRTYTEDTDSKGYSNEDWLRVYPSTHPERVNIIGDGNFESGVSVF